MSAKRRNPAAKTASEHVMPFPVSTRIGELSELKEMAMAGLTDASAGPVVCELSQVETIDAAALQFLVALRCACEQAARPFELRAPSAAFAATARSAGFADALAIDAGGVE